MTTRTLQNGLNSSCRICSQSHSNTAVVTSSAAPGQQYWQNLLLRPRSQRCRNPREHPWQSSAVYLLACLAAMLKSLLKSFTKFERKWLNCGFKRKVNFTYDVFKYPSGNLNGRFEEKKKKFNNAATSVKNFSTFVNNLRHERLRLFCMMKYMHQYSQKRWKHFGFAAKIIFFFYPLFKPLNITL